MIRHLSTNGSQRSMWHFVFSREPSRISAVAAEGLRGRGDETTSTVQRIDVTSGGSLRFRRVDQPSINALATAVWGATDSGRCNCKREDKRDRYAEDYD